MEKIELSPITEGDLPQIMEIYNYYVLHSSATFHTSEISLQEIKELLPIGHPKYKALLIRHKGVVCGYGYLSQYKKREAYDRAAEVSIYLAPGFVKKGIGKYCLLEFEKIAREASIKVLIGIISGSNIGSIRLFEKAGYEKCAHFREVGEKFGEILDVLAFQKILND